MPIIISTGKRNLSTESDSSHVSTVSSRHFYQNSALLDYAVREPRAVSLKQLMFSGRELTEDKIISSANFVRQEIPIRLAHRIHDMQSLPYVVVSNEHISHGKPCLSRLRLMTY